MGPIDDRQRTIGVIGLGRMGFPFAANLLDDGYDVIGYRRGPMDEFQALGGRPASSARQVAEQADLVFSCLPTDEALEEVVAGLGAAGREGLTLVELSTFGLAVKTQARAVLLAAGGTMLDAPVSGTPVMAQARKAVVMVSGEEERYVDASEAIGCLGPSRFVGPFGLGSKLKFVANILIAVHTAAAAEAIAFGEAAGVDAALLTDVIGASPAATSGMFAIRGPVMARERTFRPASGSVDLLRKDLNLITDVAKEVGAKTPLLTAARALYEEAAATGLGEDDIAVVVTLLRPSSSLPSR